MSRTIKKVRRQLDRVEEGLGQLQAFAVLFKSQPVRDDDGVIELVEVKPGVFAAPTRPAVGGDLLARIRAGLAAAEDLERRSQELAREKPWRRK